MSECLSDRDLRSIADGITSASADGHAHLEVCEKCAARLTELRSKSFGQAAESSTNSSQEIEPDETVAPSGAAKSLSHTDLAADGIPGYCILCEIHRGSQGVVYLGEKELTRDKVALKVMLQGPLADPTSRRRFEREIDVVGNLDHPNIAKVFDSGVERGYFYYAMQFIRGTTLTEYVSENRLSVEEALRLFQKVCEGVDYAHQRGVIHRDLKPSNILVDQESGEPYVMDFGLAKIAHDSLFHEMESQQVSVTGQIVGTPAFMSPEQAAGDNTEVDLRTDVYALGVILYILMTGRMPYEVKGTLPDMWKSIRETEPASLRAVNPTISDEIETIVLKALSKEKTRRYATAGVLGADIERYLSGEPIEARRDSVLYVFRNTLRRYQAIAAVASAIALLVAVAFVTSLAFWRQAARARDLAEMERGRALVAQEAERQARETADQLTAQLRQELYEYKLGLAVDAWESGALFQAAQHLSECPVTLRRWEWDWLHTHVRAAGLTLFSGQGRPVFTPDGAFLIAAGRDRDLGAIRIWETDRGHPVTTLRGPSNSRLQVVLNPDGSLIAAAHYDGSLALWDRASEKELWRTHPSESRSDGVSFSPDGRMIGLAGVDGVLRLLATENGDAICSLGPLGYPLRDLAFRPNGQELAVGALAIAPEPVTVWEWQTGMTRFALPEKGNADCVAYSHDGQFIVTGCADGNVTIWDANTGKSVRNLPDHSGTVFSVEFSPDDRLVASSTSDGTVRIWKLDTEEEMARLGNVGMSNIYWLRFHPDGEQVAFYTHEGIASWDPFSGQSQGPNQKMLSGHDSKVRSIDFGPEGKHLASASFDGTVKIWDLAKSEVIQTFEAHSQAVVAVAYGPRGKFIASGSHHNNLEKPCELFIWDAHTGEMQHAIHEHLGGVWWVAFHPDGTRLAAGGMDGVMRMWDVESGHELFHVDSHVRYVEGIAFSQDGKRFVTIDAGENVLKFWDADTGQLIGRSTSSVDPQRGRCVRFSADDRLIASGGVGGVAKMWDGQTGELIRELRGHVGEVTAAAFNSDGTRLFTTGHDGMTRVWNTETGKLLLELQSHSKPAWALSVSPDGQKVASAGDDGIIVIWDADSA